VLVFTTLTKEALPLVRYWTGDITSLSSEPCSCGRTLVRMDLIKGRADDMLIIRGVNVYPTQVEAALLQLSELTPNYRIVISRGGTLDEAEVEVEVSERFLREAARTASPRGSITCASSAAKPSVAFARASAAHSPLRSKHRVACPAPRAGSSNGCSIAARLPDRATSRLRLSWRFQTSSSGTLDVPARARPGRQ